MATYTPKPIDTSTVVLNNAQWRLIEQLAAHAHDVWAKKRMEDGWQHGPARNDQIKAHPSLVPYDELPDSEKDYDRVMVEQVIKAAVALGYRIDALHAPADATGAGRSAVGHWLARLRAGFSNRDTTQDGSCFDSRLPATGVVKTVLLVSYGHDRTVDIGQIASPMRRLAGLGFRP